MAKVTSFEEMFLEGLKDTYDAEHQITTALPKMVDAATSPDLKQVFKFHLGQTETQITRLEKVFELLGEKATRKKCVATAGLVAEAQGHIKEIEKGPLCDAGLIESAQKVEHYEIASYGTARTYANLLGKPEIAALLEETLKEEEATDLSLTKLAESVINSRAAAQH